ncbi:MAG: hypothetical protein R2795_27240 [Saprospiraceae bacterium]
MTNSVGTTIKQGSSVFLRKVGTHKMCISKCFTTAMHLTHCWNASFPKGMGLEQLKRQYSDHRLIVMGDAYDLIDPHALGLPNLRPSPANVLRQWRQRLLFSPVPPVSWGIGRSYWHGCLCRSLPIQKASTKPVCLLRTKANYFPMELLSTVGKPLC